MKTKKMLAQLIMFIGLVLMGSGCVNGEYQRHNDLSYDVVHPPGQIPNKTNGVAVNVLEHHQIKSDVSVTGPYETAKKWLGLPFVVLFGDDGLNVNFYNQPAYGYVPVYYPPVPPPVVMTTVYPPGIHQDPVYGRMCHDGYHIAPDARYGGELREFSNHPPGPTPNH